jgi:TolB-like protein
VGVETGLTAAPIIPLILLGRAGQWCKWAAEARSKLSYSFEDFVFDTEQRELRQGARLIPLQPQVFDVLQYLIANRHRVVSKDDLIAAVWKGRIVSESALTTRINSARTAIGDSGDEQRLIRTLPRRGFRFVGVLQDEGALPAGSSVAADDIRSRPTAVATDGTASAILPLPDRPSIAVLPFDNLSGDPAQDYFADGMVDDIIMGLSRVKWLFVIARNSTFIYKGRAVSVKDVARELGVRYVLQGSVRKAADHVRITSQLIDATVATHLWVERYDRKCEDIFALQDEITVSVVGAIEPNLRLAEVERIKRKRPDSLDAYDLVLRAQPDVYSVMPARSTQALSFLQRAIDLEPTYALAHAYASMCHHSLFLRTGLKDEHRAASVHHAQMAIEHGQDDALALSFAGFSIGLEGKDPVAARIAFDTAIGISPSCGTTYMLGSAFLGWSGESEAAIEWSERALRLSPFDPLRFAAYLSLSRAHFHRGRHEEAAAAARKAIQANPGFSMCQVQLAAALAKLGQWHEAKAAAARALGLQPTFRCRDQFAGVNCDATLARSLTEALRMTGIPE